MSTIKELWNQTAWLSNSYETKLFDEAQKQMETDKPEVVLSYDLEKGANADIRTGFFDITLSRLIYTLLMVLSSSYEAKFKSLHQRITVAKELSEIDVSMKKIKEEKLNLRNQIQQETEKLKLNKEIEKLNVRNVELSEKLSETPKEIEQIQDKIISERKKLITSSKKIKKFEEEIEKIINNDKTNKEKIAVELTENNKVLQERLKALPADFKVNVTTEKVKELVGQFKTKRSEQEALATRAGILGKKIELLPEDPLPLLESAQSQLLQSVDEKLSAQTTRLEEVNKTVSDFHAEGKTYASEKLNAYINQLVSTIEATAKKKEELKIKIDNQKTNKDLEQFETEENLTTLKNLRDDCENLQKEIESLDQQAQSCQRIITISKEIGEKSHQNLSMLLETLFANFDPQLITSWKCKENGEFTIKLAKNLNLKVPPTLDKKGESETGPVIFKLGENVENVVQGKMDAKEKSITFTKGFDLYLYSKTGIPLVGHKIQPQLVRLRDDGKNVQFKAGYGSLSREEPRALETLILAWSTESEILGNDVDFDNHIMPEELKQKKHK